MKWLNSLDELLYEVMSWLVFFPLTFWRSLFQPMSMMEYADRQLGLPEADQYADALSPPLFLALTLALAHVCATSFGEVDQVVASHRGLAAMINDDASALVFRLLIFAIFPLMMSVRMVRIRKLALNRRTLRLPFYAQCYPAGIFALGLSLGTVVAGLANETARRGGPALMLLAVFYYLAVETRWFAGQTDRNIVRSFGSAVRAFLEGFALLLVAGFLVLS